ncbi:MAG: hypothetical protein A4E63_01586 [Syntrophorhabdus sp. PtaU1.Bin050]|nr:MAG: hypothetical protein A4E63_01586 [Syntrophorhabdus sp. PtaU1.Bin050]
MDDFTICRYQFAGRYEDKITFLQSLCMDLLNRSIGFREISHGLGPCLSKGIGLGFTTAFSHGLGKICKKDREPEPQGYLENKAEGLAPGRENKTDGGNHGTYLGDKYDRVF